MSAPDKPVITYSYTGFSVGQGNNDFPGPQLDADLATITASVDETIDALADVRRADGQLVNGIVTIDALSPSLSTGFTFRGVWASGTSYRTGDGVYYGVNAYRASVAHTAGPSTRPDLAPAIWTFLYSVASQTDTMTISLYDPQHKSQDVFAYADAAVAAGVAAGIATRLPLAGGTLTGDLVVPTLNGKAIVYPTARSRNRILNPTAQISQENLSNVVSTTAAYPADQWLLNFSGVVGAAQRTTMPTVSPEGTTTCVSLYASTAKGSLATSDFLVVTLPIEGLDVADLGWGTAKAKAVVLRFCAVCATPGTYSVSVANNGASRSWLGSFTIAQANVPQVFTLAIPGDTTDTWLKDTGLGVSIRFGYAIGSNFVGTAGWQSGNFLAPAGCTNGAAIVNNPIYITDVGFHADPDGTGVAPAFNVPSYEDDLQRCLRYWQKLFALFSGNVTSAAAYSGNAPFLVLPRVTTSVSGVNNGNSNFAATVGTLTASPAGIYETRTANGTGTGIFSTLIIVNARLI